MFRDSFYKTLALDWGCNDYGVSGSWTEAGEFWVTRLKAGASYKVNGVFFKTFKRNLKVKPFVGTSPTAFLIQSWTALIAMLLL